MEALVGNSSTLIRSRNVKSFFQSSSADNLPKDSQCFEQFSLRGDMLPSYMPTRVLHKIVFIGESVDMFENNDKLDVKSKYCLQFCSSYLVFPY